MLECVPTTTLVVLDQGSEGDGGVRGQTHWWKGEANETGVDRDSLARGAGSTGTCLAVAAKALTNQDVVQMVKAGVPESTIVLAIKNSPADFKTGAMDLVDLSKAGVPQSVMDAMLTHGATDLPPGAIMPSASTAAQSSAMTGSRSGGRGD